MIQIMTVGNELYSSLSLLARQSMLMFTELPEMVTVFERFFQLQYSASYTCNMHGDARIEGYNYSMPLRPTLGPLKVTVILGDLRRFKATVGKFGQNVV